MQMKTARSVITDWAEQVKEKKVDGFSVQEGGNSGRDRGNKSRSLLKLERYNLRDWKVTERELKSWKIPID